MPTPAGYHAGVGYHAGPCGLPCRVGWPQTDTVRRPGVHRAVRCIHREQSGRTLGLLARARAWSGVAPRRKPAALGFTCAGVAAVGHCGACACVVACVCLCACVSVCACACVRGCVGVGVRRDVCLPSLCRRCLLANKDVDFERLPRRKTRRMVHARNARRLGYVIVEHVDACSAEPVTPLRTSPRRAGSVRVGAGGWQWPGCGVALARLLGGTGPAVQGPCESVLAGGTGRIALQSRTRRGRGELSPGADVAAANESRGADVAGVHAECPGAAAAE